MKKEAKHCNECEHWGSDNCPNSSECYALEDKPHYKERYVEPCWLERFLIWIKHIL